MTNKETFKALVVDKGEDGQLVATVKQLRITDLPPEDVLIQVD